jgi:hypothetical protein
MRTLEGTRKERGGKEGKKKKGEEGEQRGRGSGNIICKHTFVMLYYNFEVPHESLKWLLLLELL